MKRWLLFLFLIGLLLLYVWERSESFRLTRRVEELRAENRRLSERLLRLKAELDRLTSYSRLTTEPE